MQKISKYRYSRDFPTNLIDIITNNKKYSFKNKTNVAERDAATVQSTKQTLGTLPAKLANSIRMYGNSGQDFIL